MKKKNMSILPVSSVVVGPQISSHSAVPLGEAELQGK